MSLSAEELIEKSRDQWKRGRYDESLISALAAVDLDRNSSTAWWQVAICRDELKDWKNAAAAYGKVVELNPDADNAWAWLAATQEKLGDTDAAEESYGRSLSLNQINVTALRGMAAIYQGRDDISEHDEERSVLQRLEASSGKLTALQNSRLGSLHYRLRHYHDAIKYWTLAKQQNNEIWNIHNIGLAYSVGEISQDADAIDMWRLALKSTPDYQPSLDMIAKILPRLSDLRKNVKSTRVNLLKDDERFDFYINPFELLGVESDVDGEALDAKQIQKFKKRLLQEIELEDGCISWLDSFSIDKSRAIKVCDELNDSDLKFYHSMVFGTKDLLAFLTRGNIEHFLVGDESPLDTLELMELVPELREWIGVYFAPQFDRVLSRALDSQNLHIIECLLDGRRWVVPGQEHLCFENSRRVIDRMIQPLRDLAADTEKTKPSYEKIDKLVEKTLLRQKLNLLPLFFEKQQSDAIGILRGIAVDCVNVHDDTALSEQIINLCQNFRFKSVDLQARISQDAQTIKDIKASERKKEVFLTSGENTWRITKEGAELNGREIKVEDVTAVRWGSTIVSGNYNKEYQFVFSVSGRDGQPITFSWTASKEIEKQQKHFSNLIDAAFQYLLPSLLKRMEERLGQGEVIQIGPCRLTSAGVEISVKGWFSSTSCVVPWARCAVSVANGEMTVSEEGSPKNKVTFSFQATENAPTLLLLASKKKG